MSDKFVVGKKYTYNKGASSTLYCCDYVGKQRSIFTSLDNNSEFVEWNSNSNLYDDYVEKKTIVRYYNVYKNARGLYLGQTAEDTRELVDNAGSLSTRVGVKRVEIELVEGQFDE